MTTKKCKNCKGDNLLFWNSAEYVCCDCGFSSDYDEIMSKGDFQAFAREHPHEANCPYGEEYCLACGLSYENNIHKIKRCSQ